MLGFAWGDGIGIEFCKEHARIRIKILFFNFFYSLEILFMLGFAWGDGLGIEFCKEHARIKIKMIKFLIFFNIFIL